MRIYIVIILFLITVYFLRHFFTSKTVQSVFHAISRTNNVPNIIFRTISGPIQSKAMVLACHDEWQKLNPKYSIVWYSNHDCDRFMAQYYSGPVNNSYLALKPGAYKADLWRLCVLYRFGGIYIDAYATPYCSLDEMLSDCWNKDNPQFISVLDCALAGQGIHNGFIVAERRHPFLKQSIDDIVENVQNRYYGQSCLDITGPVCLSKSIKKVIGAHTHLVGRNKHHRYSYFLFQLKMGPYQHIYKDSKRIMSKYYSFLFFLWRTMSPTKYGTMWKHKEVY